jgi:heme/copper-type cytochrome/quinol oxidase subunit 4
VLTSTFTFTFIAVLSVVQFLIKHEKNMHHMKKLNKNLVTLLLYCCTICWIVIFVDTRDEHIMIGFRYVVRTGSASYRIKERGSLRASAPLK